MLSHVVAGSRAWRAATVEPPPSWYCPLSKRCLAALDETIGKLRREPRTITELRLSKTPCVRCQEDLEPARAALETGRGFVIIDGLPCEKYTIAEQQAVYWLVGQLLGQPFVQNVEGTLLYDVRDTGQSVCDGARFSITNAETGYHTDNSFGDTVLDYVGLLCLRTAKSGGENHLVSAYSLHNALLSRHPHVLQRLYQPLHVDRRGGVRPGESPTSQFPIFEWNGDELICRYFRYWIEDGQQKAGQPLTAAQTEALETLDEVLDDPTLRVEVTLRPGDMFFINNRWVLHQRDAFEDHAEAERRRHYVRLWLHR